ncbi:unnamed protein product [Closterium sp. Naga37s-1]|nr:unnamed protein product [Closterium sp. Naga37s-1]
MFDAQPPISVRSLARLAKVQPKQIRDWCSLKERLDKAAGCHQRLTGARRKPKYPDMEVAVYRSDAASSPAEEEEEEEDEEEEEEEEDTEEDKEEDEEEGEEGEEEGGVQVEGGAGWEDDGDEWWAEGRYDEEEVEIWVAGQD